ncbi:MAG: LamG domain-containing protein [Prolixibacteraceae bacterium]|nr:LamG domain-containing protein [Prolixibacteraceae bacterium]MBN2648811.1 LamG domain-containing protein [Prolixibacteraceae bacterium]
MGQTVIWEEDFPESNNTKIDPEGNWTLDPNNNNSFSIRSNELRANNINGLWSSVSIDISGYAYISVSVDIRASGDMENADYIELEYNVDGNGWNTFEINGYIQNNFGSEVATQNNLSGSSLLLRIRMVNSANNEYYYADNIVVTGSSGLTYCTPIPQNSTGYISNVSLNTIDNTTGQDIYTDYTETITTDLHANTAYTLNVEITTNNNPRHIFAWIDWNQNGNFYDSGEEYDLGETNVSTTLSRYITMPYTALVGETRMRIIIRYDNDPSPCDNDNFYGEAEDYTINVIECTTPVTITCPSDVTAYTNPLSGLQTYYNFNETTGTTASDEAGSNDATIENGAIWGNGQICNAVSLDGNNDYINLPDGIVSTLNDFTISTWVYWEGGGNWQRIFDFGNSNSAGYMFLTPGNGGEARFAISLTDYNGEDIIASNAGILPTNQWVHVAVSLNGSSGILYVNGINVGENNSMSLTPNNLGSTPNNWIGQSQYADPFFNGLIDEFRIYTRALSENEIKTLANTGTCAAYPDLGTPTTSGGCGNIELTNNAVMPMSVGTHTVNWTATGGPSPVTCTQTVTVENNYPAPTFTTQPNATYTVEPGNGTAVITTDVSGCDLSYQWQVSTNDGSTWTDISDASAYYSGTQTDELSITDPISDMNGYWYQLLATASHYCGITTESNPAELIVSDGTLALITSPGSQCKYGDDVTVTVSASSESYSGVFRWYSDAAGGESNLVHTSASDVSYSEYTVTISSTQTYYVEFESGGETTDLTPVTAYVIIPPSLTASVGGTFCTDDTIKLFSDGVYENLYWEGKNGAGDIIYYSNDEDPEIPEATTAMSGTYTVYTSTLSGVNLVTNGDFEDGNTDFTSAYSYIDSTGSTGSYGALSAEGYYTIVKNSANAHSNFHNCYDYPSGNNGFQMVINGAPDPNVFVWSQDVNVVQNTFYQFSYWVQSVELDNPSELQLIINGDSVGSVYTADSITCNWKQFYYNWDSGSATTATLSLVNQNTADGGNDFALDDIVFQHTCTAEASVEVTVGSGFVPGVTITADPGETICDGDLISFTATQINGGTSPSYQWYQNGIPVTNETNSTFTPATIAHLDEIYCEMTSSLSCTSGSATVDSDVLTINVIEPPTAIAGGNLFSCGLSPVEITSGASATNYSSIEWTSTGSGVFSDAASLTACTYTPSAADISAGSVTITLTAIGNSPCGDEIDTKTLTFTDPIDVKADYLFSDYCPQFLPPVSFNNDDDPRPPGRTELNFVLVPLNTSANWQFELDFDIVATPGISVTLTIDSLAVVENGLEISPAGNVYSVNALTDTVFVNAFVVNQPGHSLDVTMDAVNVTSAGCSETEEDNNFSTITIYPMPAIGKFE